MYRIACVLLLCVTALHAGVVFKDCGSTVGRYTSVRIADCDTAHASCVLKRNTNATIGITFELNKDVSAVTTVIHGVLAGVPVPFPIEHPNACADKDSGLTCPLTTAGGPYTYSATLFVEKKYPRISLIVKWELQNEDSQDIVCVEIPAKIQ